MNTLLPYVYSDFVGRLTKPGGDILEALDAKKTNVLHMAVGYIGETSELLACLVREEIDRENLIEELGDLAFYRTGMYLALGWMPPTSRPWESRHLSPVDGCHNLIYGAGALLDAAKKMAIYNAPWFNEKDPSKNLEPLFRSALLALEEDTCRLYVGLSVTEHEVLLANETKLMARYKKVTYSDAAASERADKA